MKTVFTGWRHITPGPCPDCGRDDQWMTDMKGGVMCVCQKCPYCGAEEVFGRHEAGCVAVEPF